MGGIITQPGALRLGLSALIIGAGFFLLPDVAMAQDSTIADGVRDLVGETDSEAPAFNARILQLFFLVTVLSLAPAIAMMVTCLPFMVIVFSFLRQAMGPLALYGRRNFRRNGD